MAEQHTQLRVLQAEKAIKKLMKLRVQKCMATPRGHLLDAFDSELCALNSTRGYRPVHIAPLSPGCHRNYYKTG